MARAPNGSNPKAAKPKRASRLRAEVDECSSAARVNEGPRSLREQGMP